MPVPSSCWCLCLPSSSQYLQTPSRVPPVERASWKDVSKTEAQSACRSPKPELKPQILVKARSTRQLSSALLSIVYVETVIKIQWISKEKSYFLCQIEYSHWIFRLSWLQDYPNYLLNGLARIRTQRRETQKENLAFFQVNCKMFSLNLICPWLSRSKLNLINLKKQNLASFVKWVLSS